MDNKEFIIFRKRMNKTQKQMAQLFGVSNASVCIYEKGWREIPTHVERQMFFLLSIMHGAKKTRKSCWTITECPTERRKQCPAWEFEAGNLCWLTNGTICEGIVHDSWREKMKICRSCEVFKSFL